MGLVVVYHLFPGAVTGGFVGVDVFFVISGFLITGHLARRSTARDGSTCWVSTRRARRLMPAAVVVLGVTWLASLLLLPASRLAATAQQVAASALYVQNWWLADASVDYLTAENAPSPVQHYWSLSVEEQFYVQPALFVIGLAAARLIGYRWRTAVLPLAAGLAAVSLGSSVALTGPGRRRLFRDAHPCVGVGGRRHPCPPRSPLVVVPRVAALAARWIGLALIIWSGLAYSGATPSRVRPRCFPSWAPS